MKPTTILMSEHRVIEQVLTVLERIAEACGRDGKLDADSARQVIDFLRNFADRCHHGKEEAQLFPALEGKGFDPETGPTGVMRAEHVEGRQLIAGMERAIDDAGAGQARAVGQYVSNATAYIEMLRVHIKKEDHCLFPMADRSLSGEEHAELMRAFEQVERHDIGEGVHEGFLEIANALADRYGVAKTVEATSGAGLSCGCSHGAAHAG